MATGTPPKRANFPARLPAAGGAPPAAGPRAGLRPGGAAALRGAAPPLPSGAGMDSQAVRDAMVERLRALGGMEPAVLESMLRVPRHLFLEPGLAAQAYLDNALPIGHGQTISKPSVVARAASVLLQALGARPARLLEIGTGCGYQAAVLAGVAGEVYSIERIRALHELARRNLRALRLPNLRLLLGDGMLGAPGGAPFDAVISAAAGEQAPPAWLEQLRPGGVLLAPLGQPQRLTAMRKLGGGRVESWSVEDARFVPLKSGVL
ncbi:MAG: protein-L-isoaspartate(D-aspartate) O-methyltransferase [Betaproteobacteria bacterium]|nr:protein-L-isoaspartate(D-aspartate) O-methyltransferase [Betaproteobacteria bacterium]MDE2153093.1 protein-L-isoaspartate(D-aspartate) O-methyltransferase [Betaproteobacteria bacterium]